MKLPAPKPVIMSTLAGLILATLAMCSSSCASLPPQSPESPEAQLEQRLNGTEFSSAPYRVRVVLTEQLPTNVHFVTSAGGHYVVHLGTITRALTGPEAVRYHQHRDEVLDRAAEAILADIERNPFPEYRP